MTECQVVQRTGAPERIDIGAEGTERISDHDGDARLSPGSIVSAAGDWSRSSASTCRRRRRPPKPRRRNRRRSSLRPARRAAIAPRFRPTRLPVRRWRSAIPLRPRASFAAASARSFASCPALTGSLANRVASVASSFSICVVSFWVRSSAVAMRFRRAASSARRCATNFFALSAPAFGAASFARALFARVARVAGQDQPAIIVEIAVIGRDARHSARSRAGRRRLPAESGRARPGSPRPDNR